MSNVVKFPSKLRALIRSLIVTKPPANQPAPVSDEFYGPCWCCGTYRPGAFEEPDDSYCVLCAEERADMQREMDYYEEKGPWPA